jgi:hypothetical protein
MQMMFVHHRKHDLLQGQLYLLYGDDVRTSQETRPATGIALLSHMQMMSVPHRKHCLLRRQFSFYLTVTTQECSILSAPFVWRSGDVAKSEVLPSMPGHETLAAHVAIGTYSIALWHTLIYCKQIPYCTVRINMNLAVLSAALHIGFWVQSG